MHEDEIVIKKISKLNLMMFIKIRLDYNNSCWRMFDGYMHTLLFNCVDTDSYLLNHCYTQMID